MIQVTLNFPSEQDLLAFFANKKAVVHQPGLPLESGEMIPAAELNKPKPDPKREVKPETEAKAKPEPKPEAKPAPAAEPAEAPASAASTAAPADSQTGTVEYPVLQKAVFTLAGKSREAAAEVAQSFGVKTFKDLDASKWGEALAAVNAKITELG